MKTLCDAYYEEDALMKAGNKDVAELLPMETNFVLY